MLTVPGRHRLWFLDALIQHPYQGVERAALRIAWSDEVVCGIGWQEAIWHSGLPDAEGRGRI